MTREMGYSQLHSLVSPPALGGAYAPTVRPRPAAKRARRAAPCPAERKPAEAKRLASLLVLALGRPA